MSKMRILFSNIKERKRKNREHIKKREKVGNKREGRKIKESKRKIKQGKKSCLSNKLLQVDLIYFSKN